MQQKVPCQGFTYSWVRKSKMSTSNIAKQEHAWDAKESMDDYFLFKEFLSLFKRSIPSGITKCN